MIEFRRVEDAPTLDPPTLRVTWTRIPMLWWRDVPVITVDPVELNELDVFMVEAVTRLGRLDVATFTEFTGLSESIFAALARRLHAFELLAWRGREVVSTGDPTSALAEATVAQHGTSTLDFLYLPDTDDLLAIEDGLARFEQVLPNELDAAPVPSAVRGTTVRGLLATRIKQRRVAQLPPSVVELAAPDKADQTDEPITAMAGADPDAPLPVGVTIEGSATVALHEDRPRVLLEVVGRRPRKRGNRDRPPDDDRATLDISGADGLVESWRQVVTQAGEPEHRSAAVAALAPPTLTPELLRPVGPAGWRLAITGTQVTALAEQGPLTRTIGLETRDKHTHVVTAIRFTPADRDAEQAFELDALIQHLLAHPDTAAQIVATEKGKVQRAGGPTAVRLRAWSLGHRWLVHALREQEDFHYA
jgi:hypothetical protein